jgi:hypothetical protein
MHYFEKVQQLLAAAKPVEVVLLQNNARHKIAACTMQQDPHASQHQHILLCLHKIGQHPLATTATAALTVASRMGANA